MNSSANRVSVRRNSAGGKWSSRSRPLNSAPCPPACSWQATASWRGSSCAQAVSVAITRHFMYCTTYGLGCMPKSAKWIVLLHKEFLDEAESFPSGARIELAAMVEVLRKLGPQLKRPYCDTLNGSRFANMKELRFDALPAASGGSRLPSIPAGVPSCWPVATSRAPARHVSTRP